MTAARGLTLGALALVVVLLLVLLSRGGATEYKLLFQNAGQLVKGNEVQVGGRPIGTVEEIELTDDNQASINISVDDEFAPLHEGTTARIRAASLSGVANRYVSLSPGPNNAAELKEGATLAQDRTTAIVDLDQLFNTFDARTRRGLRNLIRGSAAQFRGKERQANRAAAALAPALSSTRRLVGELNRDRDTFTRFVVETSRVMSALAERKGTLTELVSNANATGAAIGDEREGLARALDVLPPTLRRANTTFVNLRATLDDLDVLTNESKPATRRLAPFLRELRPLVADARPTISDLRRAVRTPGAENDLVELTNSLPELADLAEGTFPRAVRTLRRSQPVIDFARPYVPELVGWIRDFGQGAAPYDANGHYARVPPVLNTFRFVDGPGGGELRPQGVNQRLRGLRSRQLRRCPGASSQPRPDGGNPWRDFDGDLDCDPRQVPPGP